MTEQNTKTPYIPTAEDWAEFSKWVETTPEWNLLPEPEEEVALRKEQAIGLTTNRKYILPSKKG